MNQNRKYILIIFVLICGYILLLVKCQKPVNPSQNVEFKVRDSLIKVVEYRDSIRIKHVHHWHGVKNNPDSLPCDTFVKILISKCDTVIKYDSLTIVSLNDLVKQDSVVIGKLLKGKKEDSLSIVKLNRKLKRQKLLTKIGFGTGIILGGALTYKLN